MGARQSKRSVDIAAGKEGETVGEVAGAGGAAGEGRLERIEDADAAVTAPLKPQLNGDAPHTETIEISDKEKQLQDNGTPENEKDNTTEKEVNEKEDKEKEIILSPVNGSGDELDKESAENGDAKAAEAENNKKNKKVKKKWSLRSISFSKKDKQKPDKPDKQKKDETNGECDKVPEETAEATVPKVEVAEIKTPEETETKEPPKIEEQNEKTPETPVTEVITNGSSAPETPKEEAPIPALIVAPVPVEADAPVSVMAAAPVPVVAAAPVPVVEAASIPVLDAAPDPIVDAAPETKIEAPKEETVVPKRDELPISSLEIGDAAVELKADEEAASGEAVVTTPHSDTLIGVDVAVPASIATDSAPVVSEVCVAASSVEDAVPPPLPVNPPPSSLTAFATTTMAPHLVTATAHDPPHTPHSPHSPPSPPSSHSQHSPHSPHSTSAPIPEELETGEQDKAESPIEAALSESVTSNVTPSDEGTRVEPIAVEEASTAEVALLAKAIATEAFASNVEIVTTDVLSSNVEDKPILEEAPFEMVPPAEDINVADIALSDESAQIIESCLIPRIESNETEVVAEVVTVIATPISNLVVVPDTEIESEEIQIVLSNTDSKQIQSVETVESTVEPMSIDTAVASGQSLPVEFFSDNPISDLSEPLSKPVQVNQNMAIEKTSTEQLPISKVDSTETEFSVEDAEPSTVEAEAKKVVSEIFESVPVTAITSIDIVKQVLPTLDSPPTSEDRPAPTEAAQCREALEEPIQVAEIVSGKISEVLVESPAPVSIPEMTNGDTETTSGDAGRNE